MDSVDRLRPELRVLPEYGHPTSLWTNVVPFPRPAPRVVTYPDELGLPDELGQRLYRWSREWGANYRGREDRPDGRPRWKAGFDLQVWAREGRSIGEDLREELPGYEIVEVWFAYAENAVSANPT